MFCTMLAIASFFYCLKLFLHKITYNRTKIIDVNYLLTLVLYLILVNKSRRTLQD